MKKKVLSLILALAMVLPLVPAFDVPAFAEEAPSAPAESTENAPAPAEITENTPAPTDEATAEAEEEAKPALKAEPIPPTHELATSGTTGDCTWTLDGTVLTISGNGKMEDYSSNIHNYATDAPWGTSITKVSLGNGVTSIGEYAFSGCQALSSITIGKGVISIGRDAFRECNLLTSISIPNSTTTIGICAFFGCNKLKSITLGNNVTTIEEAAFKKCTSLTSVTIGNGVETIGEEAFYYCTALNAVYITDIEAWLNIDFGDGSSNPLDCAKNLYLNGNLVTDLVIPDGVKTINNYAFYNCTSLASIDIPNSVDYIGVDAFYNTAWLNAQPGTVVYIGKIAYAVKGSYNKIQIKEGTTVIAGGAFHDSFITSITIPDSVTTIGEEAFHNCYHLTLIEIPDSVTSIGEAAFAGCYSLPSITIPDSVASIGDRAFAGCTNLTGLSIPDGVTTIGEKGFSGCTSLTSITIPDSVTSIGNSAFYECTSLTSVNIPNSVKTIGELAFCNCDSLESVAIPDSVKTIEYGAFRRCDSLESVTIGNSLTTIGRYAFYGCEILKSITIPNSVASIGEKAFDGCFDLTNVWYSGNSVDWENISKDGYGLRWQAFIHYVDGNCDTTCNECGFSRDPLAPHSYDSACDAECNVCGFARTVYKLKTNASPTKIAQGETFTVSVVLDSSINTQGFGLNFSDAYDHSLFEWVSGDWAESIKSQSKIAQTLPGSYAAFVTENPSDISGEIFTFVLKLTGIADCKKTYEIKTAPSELLTACTEGSFISASHIYDNACDANCNTCGAERSTAPHDYSIQDKNAETHWMKCSVCGAIDESTREAHKHDNACDTDCNVCGQVRQVPDHVYDNNRDAFCNECGHERPLYTPGDLDGKEGVDMDDAIYLLFAINFPDDYPLNQPTDFDGSGEVDMDDAIYLLFHVNFSEDYPLH